MQLNPKLVKKQFEKSMPEYDKNAVVQKLMAEKLISSLTAAAGSNFDNILEAGAGTGLLTKQTAARLTFKKYYANDIVEKPKTI